MTECIHRWLGGTLRTTFAHTEMRKTNFPKIIQRFGFAHRKVCIVGTGITMFESMRGRKHKLGVRVRVRRARARASRALEKKGEVRRFPCRP